MRKRKIGQDGPLVSAVGLGCMGMSGIYGAADLKECIATIHKALDEGINIFDTGDFYGSGHNELLLREAFTGYKREDITISVKFGHMRTPDGGYTSPDCRPEAVKNFLAYTLQRLGVDYIDIYYPARLDPTVPIEDTIGAIADMVKAGYVRYIGLSEMSAETVKRAHKVHPISWLQIEYSLFSRGIEKEILPCIRELGISLSAYGVLSRGLLGGAWDKNRALIANDVRNNYPRFSGENLNKNLALIEDLRNIAQKKQATVSQLAIAWVLSRGQNIIPVIGSRKISQLKDTLGALDIDLSTEDIREIEAAIPINSVFGERYSLYQMKMLDSEK
ncbi:general stress protein 69 [Oxobacter pfennigii]|uniref:General stress protein 69 n=1 Tax=Oxobacter pfennigii TaxID=36849 RepID=A0A0P8WAE6_9CLOT|nr:aldo/keto reductase [Oxobacter pfennigii]KPU45588.1 general stress protein 69 [Oxobacter pfennigii]